jgi:hypothetical protein
VIDGRFAIPAVANDGSSAGLAADGSRLVLAQSGLRYPRVRSWFAIVQPERFRHLETIVLEGTFTFDAISPDGRTLYLIEYVSPRDISRYQVRAYDLRSGRLVPEPIIDPREAAEVMRGSPVTRATSRDGRWAYTLYDGHHPFIHALDTQRGAAVCIDLDQGFINSRQVFRMKLEPSDGSTLTVAHKGTPVAIVDTETLEVSEPPKPEAEQRPGEPEESGGVPWALVGLAALGASGVVATGLRRGRRSRVRRPEELERLVALDSEPEEAAEDDESATRSEERARECDRVP